MELQPVSFEMFGMVAMPQKPCTKTPKKRAGKPVGGTPKRSPPERSHKLPEYYDDSDTHAKFVPLPVPDGIEP